MKEAENDAAFILASSRPSIDSKNLNDIVK